MALIKVVVQEERTRYASTISNATNDEVTYWETILEVTATDPTVVAGTLRAMADKYAPVKANYRGE